MTQATLAPADSRSRPMTSQEKRVVFASSAGTIFEWYDFYLYGSLASIIAKNFFSNVNPTASYIFALLAFGQLFGFIGVLLALPAAAVTSVGLKHVRNLYYRSRFYTNS